MRGVEDLDAGRENLDAGRWRCIRTLHGFPPMPQGGMATPDPRGNLRSDACAAPQPQEQG